MTILFESAIRVTLIAAVVALVLFVMRIKTASALHAVWASVVILMMLLPVWVAWGPKASLPVLSSRAASAITPPDGVPPPLPAGLTQYAASPVREDGGYSLGEYVVPGIYLLGLFALLLRLVIGTIGASRLTSPSCVVPVTVGLLHPRIILPERSREWPRAQLDAVLAHEGEHIRRRDPLFQWIALLNRAIFWFHPLAWWLERKLSGLAEEACDAAVLARGYDAREYSEYLLDLARSVQRAGTRIEAVGMAMPGIGLKHRIRRMLSGVPVPRISRPRMACTVAVCACAAMILAAGTLVHAQSKQGPVFEVASVRHSDPNAGGDGQSKGGGGGPRNRLDHGRFTYTGTLFDLVAKAYGLNGCTLLAEKTSCALLSGGPAWLTKDHFEIQAKTPEGSPDYTFPDFLEGQTPQLQLMLQSLLADRFNLKVHKETKQLPVYALTVGKNGPKLKPGAGEMIQRKDGSVVKNRTLGITFARDPNGDYSQSRMQMIVRNRTVQELVNTLSNLLDRPLLNRTGLEGEFDFTIEYERDPDVPGLFGSVGPGMFTAFEEQLGLKFESTRAPVDVLVVDQAEQPSEN
jgi:bla regulator protein blaR1